MPHDRRTGRILLAMTGLVGVAMSVGCMRSSILRSSAGSVPELSPSGDLHPVAGEVTPGTTSTATATASASWSRNPATPPARPSVDAGANPDGPPQAGPPASPAPTDTDTLEAPAPGGPSSATPAPAGELPAPPTTMPTPLLDAEIRRAQSVNRQHIESLKAADTPAPLSTPIDTPTDRSAATPTPATTAGPKTGDPDPEVFAPLPLAASPRVADKSEPASSPGGIAIPPLIPIDRSADGSALPVTMPPPLSLAQDSQASPSDRTAALADAREADHQAEEPMPNRSESVIPDESKAVDQQIGQGPSMSGGPPPDQVDREGRPPLEIAALRLCSRVKGFGSSKPMNPDAIKPGREVLIYCEMVGHEYQPRGDAYVSRLATHLELRSGTDARLVWEQALGTAEDECPRRRHDYYVSYKITWPGSLEPGTYRLRLIQTDLIGNRATSSEIPVTIVR